MEDRPNHEANTVEEEGEVVGSIRLSKVATDTPQQVKAKVWCNTRNRFTQQISPNHTPQDQDTPQCGPGALREQCAGVQGAGHSTQQEDNGGYIQLPRHGSYHHGVGQAHDKEDDQSSQKPNQMLHSRWEPFEDVVLHTNEDQG